MGKTRTSVIDAGKNLTMGPVLLISCESGTMSIRGVPGVTIIDLKPNPNDPDDMNPVTGAVLRDGVDKLRIIYAMLKSGKHNFKTIVLDSATEMQKIFMEKIMGGQEHKIPGFKEWGLMQEQMRLAFRLFRDLPCNVIITALDQENVDELSKEVTIRPSLSGKMANEVAGFFDEVIYMQVVRVPSKVEGQPLVPRRIWHTQSNGVFMAKDRSGSLSPVEAASFFLLYNKIYGEQA